MNPCLQSGGLSKKLYASFLPFLPLWFKKNFMSSFMPFMPLWFKKNFVSSFCPFCLYGSKKTLCSLYGQKKTSGASFSRKNHSLRYFCPFIKSLYQRPCAFINTTVSCNQTHLKSSAENNSKGSSSRKVPKTKPYR